MGTNIIHLGEPLYILYKVDELYWNDNDERNFSFGSLIDIYKNNEHIITLSNNAGFSFIKRSDMDDVYIDISITDTSFLSKGEYVWTIDVLDVYGNILKTIYEKFIIIDEQTRNIERNVKPWDLLNNNIPRVAKDISNSRYEICKSCPRFKAGICLECGCLMKLKTTLSAAYCPLHKWGTV